MSEYSPSETELRRVPTHVDCPSERRVVKERPILFSAPMVRALLEGRKTQTRRVFNPQPHQEEEGDYTITRWKDFGWFPGGNQPDIASCCPYGVPGDRLWVRETWGRFDSDHIFRGQKFYYAADTTPGSDGDRIRQEYGYKYKPSIHMPREASRLTLEITRVRVERVQDISANDALGEGVAQTEFWTPKEVEGRPFEEKWWDDCEFWSRYPKMAFHKLWDSINASRGYGWDKNPWVWVIEFRRVATQDDSSGVGTQAIISPETNCAK